jgi:hypothetical protein
VLSCLGVSVPLCQAEVNQVQQVLFFIDAYQEIVWLHISMNKVLIME